MYLGAGMKHIEEIMKNCENIAFFFGNLKKGSAVKGDFWDPNFFSIFFQKIFIKKKFHLTKSWPTCPSLWPYKDKGFAIILKKVARGVATLLTFLTSHKISRDRTRSEQISQDRTISDQVSSDLTRSHKIGRDLTISDQISQDLTGSHKEPRAPLVSARSASAAGEGEARKKLSQISPPKFHVFSDLNAKGTGIFPG